MKVGQCCILVLNKAIYLGRGYLRVIIRLTRSFNSDIDDDEDDGDSSDDFDDFETSILCNSTMFWKTIHEHELYLMN